ncbi:MAG: glycerate kinase type-2 family protein [Candidatus Kariarchaeaceae archaeon]
MKRVKNREIVVNRALWRNIMLDSVEVALSSINPYSLVKNKIISDLKLLLTNLKGSLIIISFGKASILMAEAMLDFISTIPFDPSVVKTLISSPSEKTDELNQYPYEIEYYKGGHPFPTEQSQKAATRALNLAYLASETDLVICLVSGGGSALLAKPMEALNLSEKKSITSALMLQGASIDELNTVRKHLSSIKGGRLAVAAFPAKIITLAISDVPTTGDDPSIIASGPTIADSSTIKEAQQILLKYHLNEKFARIYSLIKNNETPKPFDNSLSSSSFEVIANGELALTIVAEFLEKEGIRTAIISTQIAGEARIVGQKLAEEAVDRKEKRPFALLYGGETTVHVKGKGQGGRNQELVLGALEIVKNNPNLKILSIGTDGIDGNSLAAGGIIDHKTVALAHEKGLDCSSFLEKNDSYSFLELTESAIITGPTGTNVSDIILIFVS